MATAHFEFPLSPIYLPQSATTLVGFRDWAISDAFPQQGRISYVRGGLIIDMSPERPETHAKLKAEISHVIYQLVKDRDLGTFYPDRTLLTNLAADISTEPDALFASWDTLQSERLTWKTSKPDQDPLDYQELVGTPDWVLEIVSASSVRKDTQLLRDAYHAAGVREYWLIDARGEEIDFQLLVHESAAFQAAAPGDGWHESPLFGAAFKIERERDRMNLWRYTLHVRQP